MKLSITALSFTALFFTALFFTALPPNQRQILQYCVFQTD